MIAEGLFHKFIVTKNNAKKSGRSCAPMLWVILWISWCDRCSGQQFILRRPAGTAWLLPIVKGLAEPTKLQGAIEMKPLVAIRYSDPAEQRCNVYESTCSGGGMRVEPHARRLNLKDLNI